MRKAYHVFLLIMMLGMADVESMMAKQRLEAVKGVMDLRTWDLKVDGNINLDGEWEFYWDQLLSPDDFKQGLSGLQPGFISVPGYWDKFEIDGKPVGGTGMGTFRLKLKNLRPNQLLSLDIPLMHTAYILWANGKIIADNGAVGRSALDSLPQYLPKTPGFVSGDGTVELVLQISNFSHNNGGIWQTITLGTNQSIDTVSQLRTAFDLFLLGAILIMSLYHFGLFALRHKEGSTMFFGLFCLVISFRLAIHGSTIFSVLFPTFSWEVLVKLDYFGLYFGLIFFSAFLQSLYPQEFSKRFLTLLLIPATGYIFFTIVVPARIFTAYLVYFQLIMVLSCLYYLYVLTKANLRKREGAAVVLGGCVILIGTLVNDILYNHEIIHTADLVGAGLFVLIFSQSFVLSLRFSKAFFTVEELSANLEEQVKERTAAVKDLLDNTGQGFFSFAEDYTIQQYTSRAVREFFGKPIENENALKLLFSEKAHERQEVLDMIFSQNGNLELFEELLPTELPREGKIYQMDYHWIPAQNRMVGRIMIVLTDITTQRDLEQKLKEDEDRNRMIVKIAVDRHGFIGFLNEINRCIEETRRILARPVSDIQADILFRHYHTIKGGLASYAFKESAEKAHLIESHLEPIRSGKKQLDAELV
ncbi:Hpt domain-containing protein, partial [bacterium]|nr:Hpt domain-containing protein [bacterium]